jgi:hypothetical protein
LRFFVACVVLFDGFTFQNEFRFLSKSGNATVKVKLLAPMRGTRPLDESNQFLIRKFGFICSKWEKWEAVVDFCDCRCRFASRHVDWLPHALIHPELLDFEHTMSEDCFWHLVHRIDDVFQGKGQWGLQLTLFAKLNIVEAR